MDKNSINKLALAVQYKKYLSKLSEEEEKTVPITDESSSYDIQYYKYLKILDTFLKKSEPNKSEDSKKIQTILEKITELPQKNDLIKTQKEIIKNIRAESAETQKHLEEQIEGLKQCLSRYLPYKRTFRMSFYFTTMFSVSWLSYTFFDIQIIHPFWSFLGMLVSCGFLIMSYFLFLDWKKGINDG